MADNFDDFYKDLKETEKADSSLTPKQQIDRLLRPGSTYRNLNPYEVLQVDPETNIEDVSKKYRRMSVLVHPDKNPDDRDRAQAAFDALRKAYSLLNEDSSRKKCYEIVEEARGRTAMNMEDKRKRKRREVAAKGLPLTDENLRIEEDDADVKLHAVHVLTMKLFADLERKRRELENRISEDAQRKREVELEAEERRNTEKEFSKNWEESRQGRVNSWLNFTGKTTKDDVGREAPQPKEELKKKKKKEKRFTPMGFRPPKHKPESRD